MKLNDPLPRVKLAVANILWPNKKVTTFKDFLSEAISFIGRDKSIKKYPYYKVELAQMFIELINELDENLKEAVTDIFFIDFVKGNVDLSDFDKSNKYNDVVNLFNLEKIEKINKFILHRDLIVNSKNQKYCDFLLNVLDKEILNNQNVSKITNIIADINYLINDNENVFNKLEECQYKLLNKLVKNNDYLSIGVLINSNSDVLLTALKDSELLKSIMDVSVNLMRKENVEACFAFFIKVIKELPHEEEVALINKINVNEILNCNEYSLNGNNLIIKINKGELLLLNYWNKCFEDILKNELSSNTLEKELNLKVALSDILSNGLDKEIVTLNKIDNNKEFINVDFTFNEKCQNSKENVGLFLSLAIKKLLLDLDNISNNKDVFIAEFEKVIMNDSNKYNRSKLKIKKILNSLTMFLIPDNVLSGIKIKEIFMKDIKNESGHERDLESDFVVENIKKLLENLNKTQEKFLNEYKNFSKSDKEKYHRVDNATGGFTSNFLGVKTNRHYGDLPRETVSEVFLKSDLLKTVQENLTQLKSFSLKDVAKIADTPSFKEYEKNFIETNNKYREMTKSCVNNEDVDTASKLMNKFQERIKSFASKEEALNPGAWNSLDSLERLAKENKNIMNDTLNDVPGGQQFLDKIKSMGFPENFTKKMNKGLDKMIEFCENPVDRKIMDNIDDQMLQKASPKKFKLY